MRLLTLVTTAVLCGCSAVRLVPPDEMQGGTRAQNLDFEEATHAGGIPVGWFIPRGGGSGSPEEYQIVVVRTTRVSGRASLQIRAIAQTTTGHGGVMQCFRNPAPGQQSLIGHLKALKADHEGGSLWIRADSESGENIAFQNMDQRRIKGTTDWERHSVRIEVPPSAVQLCFGVFHRGPGTLWADQLSLDEGA